MRTTAIAELRRGVDGDPQGWIEAIGIAPRSLDTVLRERPATIENRWFARLYLLESADRRDTGDLLVHLRTDCVSPSPIGEALDLMTRFGFPGWQSHAFIIVSSLADIVGRHVDRLPQDASSRPAGGHRCCRSAICWAARC